MGSGLILWLLACAPEAGPRSLAPDGFWATWGDGRAEVDAYHLVEPRYGEARDGTAVLVFVTETFTRGARVKSDGGHDDEFPVMKLNDARDFRTGIYDYHLLTSTFAPLDGDTRRGVPTKVVFTSQEWCGSVFDAVVVDGDAARRMRHSYFDGEGDVDDTLHLGDAVFADALPIVARGLVGPLPEGPIRVFPTLADVRLQHGALAAVDGAWTVADTTHARAVPAGTFEVRDVTLALADGATTVWEVEEAPPRRIVAWRRSDGEAAELTGSERRKYWEEHRNADAPLREGLGLP